MRDVADEDVEPVDMHRSRLRARQSFDSVSQARPHLTLVLEQDFDLVDHERG
jgi:hypothetical protein